MAASRHFRRCERFQIGKRFAATFNNVNATVTSGTPPTFQTTNVFINTNVSAKTTTILNLVGHDYSSLSLYFIACWAERILALIEYSKPFQTIMAGNKKKINLKLKLKNKGKRNLYNRHVTFNRKILYTRQTDLAIKRYEITI
jgi:hypothetical protein